MNKNIFPVVGLLVISGFFVCAADNAPEITVTNVAGNIYMIEGSEDHSTMLSGDWARFSGGNIGVSVGGDGVLIVDAKYVRFSDKVKDVINSISGNAPKFILNTHYHDDHVNANSEFSEKGIVIAHTNARTRIMSAQKEESWPVITFDNRISIHLNGEEIRVLHYPHGHTDGDAVIFFTKSNVVHMGDLYFNGYLPFTDLDNGGDVEGYLENIESILSRIPDDVKIIPGHGPVAGKQDLLNYYRMLRETIGLVTSQMEAGKSLEEIKNKGIQPEWSGWAWAEVSPESYIEIIYKSYSR